jgi:hypothetical protein
MSNQTKDQNRTAEERDFLKQANDSSNNYLSDLRQKYFGGEINASNYQHKSELVRTYLQKATGLDSNYLSDLWEKFLNDQGIQAGTLRERIRVYFRTT